MPKLREAFDVIEAWGFKYTTCAFTWVKLNPSGEGIYSGLGHWTNGNAELCLFAKKGSPKRQAKNVKQIVMSPRSRHSAKPPEVRDRIVSLIGDLPRIELFARTKCKGWDCWGNEV
jgi:site-specific DNA-methyltransferase (adenine-specific)